MYRYMLYLIFFISLLGCATALVEPKTLKIPDTKTSFQLPKEITYSDTRGLGYKVIEGLKPGVYTAEYEDADGKYFRGPEDCVIFMHEGLKEARLGNGGIWIPKHSAKNKSMRLYGYIEEKNNPTNPQAGFIINSLIEKDYGRIGFSPNIKDQDFIKKIYDLKIDL